MICATLLVLLAGTAAGQTKIPGRIIDAERNPVANTEVLLHAVTEQTGSQIDTDTSNADGSFELTVKTLEKDAVYFVAVVYNGELYMGDMMRAPFPLGQEYVVQVGVNPVDLGPEAAGTQVTTFDAEENRTAGLMVIVVSLAVVAGVVFLAMRHRPPAHRRWLVELARIEEDLTAQRGDDALLQKRRADLRARFTEPESG